MDKGREQRRTSRTTNKQTKKCHGGQGGGFKEEGNGLQSQTQQLCSSRQNCLQNWEAGALLLGQFSRSVGGRSQVTLSGRGNRKGELGNWWRIIVTEIQWMGARAQRIVQVPLRPRGRRAECKCGQVSAGQRQDAAILPNGLSFPLHKGAWLRHLLPLYLSQLRAESPQFTGSKGLHSVQL